VTINRTSIHNAGNRMVALYWYQSTNRVVADEYLGKFLLVRDALVEGRTGGSIVRITFPDTSDSLAEASQFAASLMREVQRCLGREIPATSTVLAREKL
jgi:EpsI family protein